MLSNHHGGLDIKTEARALFSYNAHCYKRWSYEGGRRTREILRTHRGKVSDGFDFLGYQVTPGRRLRPSAESIRRLSVKFRRLYERGASTERLWRYVTSWCRWLWGGLDGMVSRKGGTRRVFVRLLRLLDITGFPLPDMCVPTSVNEKDLLSSSG